MLLGVAWDYFYKGCMNSTVHLTRRGPIKTSSEKKTTSEPRSHQAL